MKTMRMTNVKEELDKERISYEICESRIRDLAGRLDEDGLIEHEVMMEERERVGKRISSLEDAGNAAVIAAAVADATLTTWSDIHGHVRDAICIPHPPGDSACWGDYPAETLEAIEAGAVARLAPGRKVVDGAGDEDGDYLMLADTELDTHIHPNAPKKF